MAGTVLSQKDELQIYGVLSDPIKWAESTLRDPRPGKGAEKIKLRPYQKEILRSKSDQIVLRLARRLGKTMVMSVHMLWYAFTHAESMQLVITPYDSQASTIFDTLTAFIESTPELAASVARNRQSPHEIVFKNKSKIKGFTAGTKSGAEGGTVRGQGGDFIYLDEADYLSDKDFETIYGMKIEEGRQINLWMSSTPTGRRSHFFRACTQKEQGWEEFHYNITCHPEWGPKMEAKLRSVMSELGYLHEFMAEFGDEEVGVFKKQYIERATQKYEYLRRADNVAIRYITADFDKYANATQILVTEFNPHTLKLSPINRVEIPQSQFTLDNAVQKIKVLNDIYQPEKIYLDRGLGEHQVESLQIWGLKHPRTKLKERVQGIHFGSSKEISDPITGEKRNVPLKAFMVNQLTLLFERDMINIAEHDTDLIEQLHNYRVVRRTIGGAPVYSSDGEHIVDCLSLATLALYDNHADMISELVPYKPSNEVVILTKQDLKFQRDYTQKIDDDGDDDAKDKSRTELLGWHRKGTSVNRVYKRKMW